jgi:hypothetical protein
MRSGLVQTTFVVQLVAVTVFFLLAAARSRRLGRAHFPAPSRPVPASGPEQTIGPDTAALERLEQECARLTQSLDLLRAAHAEEEAGLRVRRRAALLEMHEHRRITAELRAEEPKLQGRVQELRAEVEHLEHRRTALAAEISASTRTSVALRDRAVLAQRELASLRLDRERVGRRIRSDGQRLRDLARRRSVLRAETEELAALLELLQRLADQPTTLTFLSDGELRTGPTRRPGAVSGTVAGVPWASVAAERTRSQA